VVRVIRLLVVDDHPSMATGLAALLQRETDIEVVGVAGDVEEALRLAGELSPSVVLCDVQLQGQPGGFEILRQLNGDSAPDILMFTSYDYPAFRGRALELGAAGFLLKTARVSEIVAAIRAVAAGGTAFTAATMREASRAPRLPSKRELALIRLIKEGLSNNEVAGHLGIGTRGVESSLRRMFARYGLMSRTELVTFGEKQGWLALWFEGEY
jgi:DNA-binding NarL/FixJ family response regulator